MTDQAAVPLYLQLSEMLIREINTGRLADGQRLPPERDMAVQMGTSVGTLRKALSVLSEKGLLDRRQGSGNYVRARDDVQSIYAMFRIERHQGGGLLGARVLDFALVPKPDDLPPFGLSDQAHRIRRLRLLDGVPAVLEDIWLDASYATELPLAELAHSLYLFYRERLGLWIARAEDKLTLGAVPDWAPEDFGLSPGAPCVLNTRVSYASDGIIAEVSRNWINSDIAAYVARVS